MDQPREFVAGPLRVLFDGDGLRYFRAGGAELVQRIHMPVRDESWGTVPPVVQNLRAVQEAGGAGFHIEFDAEHRQGSIDFMWHAVIDARATEGGATVTFSIHCVARTTLRACRAGFCVLHPLDGCAGKPVEVEHIDGTVERSHFPRLIAPHQPFTDVRAVSHEPAPGVRVTVRMEGDAFETEDQRNWTDASFKTYCRPLGRPFPYVIEKGQVVTQTVTVTVAVPAEAPVPAYAGVAAAQQDVWRAPALGRLPRIGLQRGSIGRELTAAERELLRPLRLSHLRVDLHPSRAGLPGELAAAASDAAAIGVPLEVAVHLSANADAELEALARQFKPPRPDVCRLIIYEAGRPMASGEAVGRARRRLATVLPRLPIGGGTLGSFAELNRQRPPAGTMDVVAYPVNPQMHATDDLALMENMTCHGDTVRTAREFAVTAHVAVGPVTLHRRPDPFAAGKRGSDAEAVAADPRQRGALGAAWTLGSVMALAEAGADSVTYYDVTGPLGVMDEAGVFPLYNVLAYIGHFAGAAVVPLAVPVPPWLRVFGLRRFDRLRVLFQSTHWGEQCVDLSPLRQYGPSHLGERALRKVVLPPYGIGLLDFPRGMTGGQ